MPTVNEDMSAAAVLPEISHVEALQALERLDWDGMSLEANLAELGSPLPSYFRHRRIGGLLLQQVPAELAALLRYLWRTHPWVESYLEIGVGSCGTLTVLLESWRHRGLVPKVMVADNLSYPSHHLQRQRAEWAKARYGLETYIGNTSSPAFANAIAGRQFDVIFVDGDHSFRGSMHDLFTTYPRLKPGGTMILHDVTSVACPGVGRTMRFARRFFHRCEVFSESDTCGIAVLTGRTHDSIPRSAYAATLARRVVTLALARVSKLVLRRELVG